LVLSSSVLARADRARNAGRDDTQEAWTRRSRFVDWNRLHNVGSPVRSRCPNMLTGPAPANDAIFETPASLDSRHGRLGAHPKGESDRKLVRRQGLAWRPCVRRPLPTLVRVGPCNRLPSGLGRRPDSCRGIFAGLCSNQRRLG
jgi:hypothetical protein